VKPVRLKEIRSLIWLCRWHNGRAQRLHEVHQNHLAMLQSLVLDELGGTPQQDVELMLCGFSVRVSPGLDGLTLVSIAPPELFDGEQLALFSDDELAAAIRKSHSTLEVMQHETAA
jgi:hypothetical protein